MVDTPPVNVETCDSCGPYTRATYVAMKDDMDLTLCDHHTFALVDLLVAKGFHLQLLPGARPAKVPVNG